MSKLEKLKEISKKQDEVLKDLDKLRELKLEQLNDVKQQRIEIQKEREEVESLNKRILEVLK